jgi:hypothetical protein
MYILPYAIVPVNSKEFDANVLWLFMSEGGQTLWETDETDPDILIREHLLENGFRGDFKGVKEGVCLFEVEPGCMRDFYTILNAEDDSADVWRPFFLVNSPDYGWDTQISSLGTVGHIIKIINGLKTT